MPRSITAWLSQGEYIVPARRYSRSTARRAPAWWPGRMPVPLPDLRNAAVATEVAFDRTVAPRWPETRTGRSCLWNKQPGPENRAQPHRAMPGRRSRATPSMMGKPAQRGGRSSCSLCKKPRSSSDYISQQPTDQKVTVWIFSLTGATGQRVDGRSCPGSGSGGCRSADRPCMSRQRSWLA